MKSFVFRTAIVTGVGAMAMAGMPAVASAIQPEVHPQYGVFGVTFSPDETKMIANSGAGSLLGHLPPGMVRVRPSKQVRENTGYWSPETAQYIFNDSAAFDEGITVALINPLQWDGRFVFIRQFPNK